MPDFKYEALAGNGQRANGTLSAGNEREVLAMLDTQGLYPVKIEQAVAQTRSWGGRRVRGRHLATLYSQLADLLRAGVPLLKSLDILERQSSQPTIVEMLREVRMRVADGSSLADAMAEHPRVFSELAVSMVRAGQEGGFLEDVLKRIADFTEKQEDLKAKVIKALAYPVFLAIIGFVVLNVLVIFFVPMFEPMFKRLEERGELPFITEVLLGFSTFLQSKGVWLILLLVFGVFLYWRWSATEQGRFMIDSWRLRLPGAGRIYLSLAIARFTRILGTLLRNGIPILQALRISKDSTGNKVLTQAIEQAAENITVGSSLAAPLAACHHFPRDVVEMVAVGQESNNLEEVLLDMSDSLEKRTARQLDLFVGLLEPVMLLFMAGVILIVLLGLLLPVFKMGGTVR